jgi:recombinational DNA repair ATPase RecF
MRLAEWHYLKLETQGRPLMIVDDFGSSLDQTRKKRLFTELSKLGQLFLSSHSQIDAPHAQVHTVHMSNGKICLPE